MNFIIPKGTMFLKSINASAERHTADFLLKEINIVIDYNGGEECCSGNICNFIKFIEIYFFL